MEWYEPTEKEREAIERAGLEAAWEELQPLLDEELEMPRKVAAGVKAFRAARKAIEAAKERLKEERGADVSCWPEVFSLVASAGYALDVDIEDVHPYCVGGNRLEAVMRAALVFKAIHSVWDALDDDEDDVLGLFLEEEAGRMAAAFSKA